MIQRRYEQAIEATGEQVAIDIDALARLVLAIIGGFTLQYVARPDPQRARTDLARALNIVIAAAVPQSTRARAG